MTGRIDITLIGPISCCYQAVGLSMVKADGQQIGGRRNSFIAHKDYQEFMHPVPWLMP